MEHLSCLGRYHISSIRCRGYYFFHCMLLCGYIFEGGYYSRVVFVLWKACRHQRQLDMSDKVMTVKCCR